MILDVRSGLADMMSFIIATNKIFPLMHYQPRLTEYRVDCQCTQSVFVVADVVVDHCFAKKAPQLVHDHAHYYCP